MFGAKLCRAGWGGTTPPGSPVILHLPMEGRRVGQKNPLSKTKYSACVQTNQRNTGSRLVAALSSEKSLVATNR